MKKNKCVVVCILAIFVSFICVADWIKPERTKEHERESEIKKLQDSVQRDLSSVKGFLPRLKNLLKTLRKSSSCPRNLNNCDKISKELDRAKLAYHQQMATATSRYKKAVYDAINLLHTNTPDNATKKKTDKKSAR